MTLDRLTELEAAATEGEWFAHYSSVQSALAVQADAEECVVCRVPSRAGDTPTVQGSIDSNFIVALRNAAPLLLAVAKAGRAVVETRESWLKNHEFDYGPEIERKIDELRRALRALEQ